MNSDDFFDEKARSLNRAFHMYNDTFTKYFSITISLTEAIPDQINNHIRNAFTHLSRAHESDDITTVEREVEKAISHIERGNRDCLKICVAHQHDKIEALFSAIRFNYGFVTPSINSAKKSIQKERQNLLQEETKGNDNITIKFEELLRKSLELEEYIYEQYSDVSLSDIRLLRFLQRHWRILSWPIFTIIGTVIGYVMSPYIEKWIPW